MIDAYLLSVAVCCYVQYLCVLASRSMCLLALSLSHFGIEALQPHIDVTTPTFERAVPTEPLRHHDYGNAPTSFTPLPQQYHAHPNIDQSPQTFTMTDTVRRFFYGPSPEEQVSLPNPSLLTNIN